MITTDDKEYHWSEFFTGEKVPKSDSDMRAHRFYAGFCVECGKGKQENPGNYHMPGQLTHCDKCFLEMSAQQVLARHKERMIENPKAVTGKVTKKENWYE